MPGTNLAFITRVDPVSPPQLVPTVDTTEENGGGAGYCPRVRNAYSTRRLAP